MDEHLLVDICAAEDGSVRLGRTEDGAVWSCRESRWERYDFNGTHRGFYPACTFTALARAGEFFCLAGLDESGAPHVFSSLLGGVWEERNLTACHPLLGERRASGRVVRILYDGENRQTFLLCSGGELVTLPDCPRCVRITDIPGGTVEDGWLEGRDIVVRSVGGTLTRIGVDSVAQYRISRRYLDGLLEQGAVLVDLRAQAEHTADRRTGGVHVPLEDIEDWLEEQDKARPLVFLCHTGINADRTARYARQRGFARAYSMGGTVSAAQIP